MPTERYTPGQSGGLRPIEAPIATAPLDPARWYEVEQFIYGMDLFHHGFYWEAHAEWEALWRASIGDAARLAKALIKIAGAGVKLHQGHLTEAHSLLRKAEHDLSPLVAEHSGDFCGLDLTVVLAWVQAALWCGTTLDELRRAAMFTSFLPVDLEALGYEEG